MMNLEFDKRFQNLNYDYDSESDVLYISIGKPKISIGNGDPATGIVVRKDIKTDKISGLTIVGFKQMIKKDWFFDFEKYLPNEIPIEYLMYVYFDIFKWEYLRKFKS